jgi:hypothetical protein
VPDTLPRFRDASLTGFEALPEQHRIGGVLDLHVTPKVVLEPFQRPLRFCELAAGRDDVDQAVDTPQCLREPSLHEGVELVGVHVGARGAGPGSCVLAVVGDDVGTVYARASNNFERPPTSTTASESEQEAVPGRICPEGQVQPSASPAPHRTVRG